MPRSKLRRVLLALPVVAALAIAVWWWQRPAALPETTDLVLYGNVDIREVDLAFQGDQRIAEILVDEGDRVDKDEVVARMETDRLVASVALARAHLEQQQQIVAQLRAGSRREEIERARADVAAANATLRDAELTHARAVDLVERKINPQQRLDDALAALDAARARRDALQKTLELAILGPREEEIAAAQAIADAQAAALSLAEKNLADAELRAPAPAIVRDRIQEPGELASPERPALTLALTDPVWVRCYVPEPDLGRLRPGARAEVRTDSFPMKDYVGWVGYLSPTAEFTPKSVETPDLRTRLVYQARIFVENPDGELRLGMPATVVIPAGQSAASIRRDEQARRRDRR